MTIRKWTAALIVATLVTTAGTALAATVPAAVYNDFQAASSNKPAAQVQQELEKAGVKDVKADEYYAGSVAQVLGSGLMKPAEDGTFQPEKQVGTAEGLAVFAKVLGIASKTDTDDQAVTKMKEAGLVDVNASIENDMSRKDFAKLIALALGIEAEPVTNAADYPFADYADVTPAEAGILKALYQKGIFKGSLDNGVLSFQANGILTRAQLAILVDRILGAK